MKLVTKFFRRQPGLNRSLKLYTSPVEVSQGAVEVWAKLPTEIRDDPSLAIFRREYQRMNGSSLHEQNTSAGTSNNVNQKRFSITGSTGEVILITGDDIFQREKSTASIDKSKTDITKAKTRKTMLIVMKIAVLVGIWLFCTSMLMLNDEKELHYHPLVIQKNENTSIVLNELPPEPRFGIIVTGAFDNDEYSSTANFLCLQVQHRVTGMTDNSSDATGRYHEYASELVRLPIVANISKVNASNQVMKTHVFHLDSAMYEHFGRNSSVVLWIHSNLPTSFPITIAYDLTPIDQSLGVIYAAIILAGLYGMIIWEIIDRTFAAMVATTVSISILAFMNDRPTMPEIVSWIDIETVLLLFGMMILVGILSETGLFDFMAIYAFKISKGNIWPLICCLCLFTAILSAILDNVTTLLLMTPICIRLCEAMQLNPVPILMSLIIFSNIGGCMTPVGDPPNIIIASNSFVVETGVDFLDFVIHMSGGAILVMIQTGLQLRLKYRTVNDLRIREPDDVRKIRRNILIWERAANTLSLHLHDEKTVRDALTMKIKWLQQDLKERKATETIPEEVYKETLEELQGKYPIKNHVLLVKSVVVLVFVVGCFFLHSLPYIERLSLGWIALLGAILLLILYDSHDIESILSHVEWSTLLFFAALFVLMESLAKLGLIDFIGSQTESIIFSVNEQYRLSVAILMILWISAITSAFVDNIPLTTMMIRVTVSLAENKALNLPLQPLIWALSFGACLGGNGTLIGASANIVCASIAEQHGYRFTFMDYFKVAFPAMIGSLVVVSGYLLISHDIFVWH